MKKLLWDSRDAAEAVQSKSKTTNHSSHKIINMANGQYICQGDTLECLFTWRDGNRLCKGYDSVYTIRDEKYIYKGDGYETAWTVRDNNSYIACCKGDSHDAMYVLRDGKYIYAGTDSYETVYTLRDQGSYVAICKGDSHETAYSIREGNLTTIEIFAVLSAVGGLA